MYTSKNTRGVIQDSNNVEIMAKNMTIDRLLLLVSCTKVEALAVRYMISYLLTISPRFLTLMSYNMDGVECLAAAP